jgi:hypothetical protein
MSNTMNKVKALAANGQLPLSDVFQQCYDEEHLSPKNNYDAWDTCLKEVYSVRNPKPSVAEFGDAMYNVWKDAGGLTRTIMINALKSIADYTNDSAIYTEVNKYYPITVLMTIDTTRVLSSGYLSSNIVITDDNGDPNQGSNEIRVTAKVKTKLIWKAVAKNGTDTIQLKEFKIRRGQDLFTAPEPNLQADGTYKGTLTKVGSETYAYNISINNGSQMYTWDPFITSLA